MLNAKLNKLYLIFFFCLFSVCEEDEEFKRDNRHCWTGDRIGDYTHSAMPIGVDAQRYNPEVPLEGNDFKTNKLNEFVDVLIKLRHTIANAVSRM